MSMSRKAFLKMFPEQADKLAVEEAVRRDIPSPDKPMLQMKFAERFIKDIKSGKKTQTIRKYKDINVGDTVVVEGTKITLHILCIARADLRYISDSDMVGESLTLAEFKEFWISVYHDYNLDDTVYIIQFEVVKKKSKYNSRKIEIDGITFDSEREARYSQGLDILAKAGEINAITYQPKFVLQEGFRKNGVAIRAINYIADFEVEYADGRTEIVDVKGFKTPIYRLKKKLFEYKYPNLILKEV